MNERTIGVPICCSIVAFPPHGHNDPFTIAFVLEDMSFTSYIQTNDPASFFQLSFVHFFLFPFFAVSLSAIFVCLFGVEMHRLVSFSSSLLWLYTNYHDFHRALGTFTTSLIQNYPRVSRPAGSAEQWV